MYTKEQKELIKAALMNGDLESRFYSDFEYETEKEINDAYSEFNIFGCTYEAGTVLCSVDPVLFREIVLARMGGYVENPAHVWGDATRYIRQEDLDEFLTVHEASKSLKDTPAN